MEDRSLLQAGAWLAGFFGPNPASILRPPIPVPGMADPLSDVPIPNWPFGVDHDATSRALDAFVSAGLLESAAAGGYQQTALGQKLLLRFPLYHLCDQEALPRRFPRLTEAVRGRRVLDAGCGFGAYSLMMGHLKPALALALDYDPEILAIARTFARHTDAQVRFMLGSVESLPLPDKGIDFILGRLVLPYVHHGRAVAEFARILSPGGQALLMLQGPRFSLFLLSRLGFTQQRLDLCLCGMLSLLGGAAFDFLGCEPSWQVRTQPFNLAYERRGPFERLLHRHGLQLEHWERGAVKPYAWVRKPP